MSRFILAPARPELQGPVRRERRGFLAKLAALAAGGTLLGAARRTGAAPASALALDPYIGEIAIVAFNFAPRGWALCNGQVLPISQNTALFSLLGSTYGGNGQSTFALPNLQDRFALHVSPTYPLGSAGGEAAHTLTPGEMPAHTHGLVADSNPGTSAAPAGLFVARNAAGVPAFGAGTSSVVMHPGAVGAAGGGQAHNNLPPFLSLSFIIALQGVYPSQS
jgi:microcystin-dependent protein